MNNDSYVYEGTSVLINKLNIRDSDRLDKAESDFASLAISQLRNGDFEVDSIYDFLEIHKRLFPRYMIGRESQGPSTSIKPSLCWKAGPSTMSSHLISIPPLETSRKSLRLSIGTSLILRRK